MGWYATSGLWNDHTAASVQTFDTNFGAQEVTLDAELIGELSLGLGGEVFVSDDWSLLLGYDYRSFEPENTPGFLFETVTSQEWALGARWHVPYTFGSGARWRPFLEAKMSYVPSTKFEAEVDLSSIGQPNPEYRFDGSSYWNAGLAAGLEYQWGPGLVFRGSVMHEWALSQTTDEVHLDFLPGFPVDLDTKIDPEGTMLLVGITWYP